MNFPQVFFDWLWAEYEMYVAGIQASRFSFFLFFFFCFSPDFSNKWKLKKKKKKIKSSKTKIATIPLASIRIIDAQQIELNQKIQLEIFNFIQLFHYQLLLGTVTYLYPAG